MTKPAVALSLDAAGVCLRGQKGICCQWVIWNATYEEPMLVCWR